MTRIGALRLAFGGLALFVCVSLMRDLIGYEVGSTVIGLFQSLGLLMTCYGFYRFLVLGEAQKHEPAEKTGVTPGARNKALLIALVFALGILPGFLAGWVVAWRGAADTCAHMGGEWDSSGLCHDATKFGFR